MAQDNDRWPLDAPGAIKPRSAGGATGIEGRVVPVVRSRRQGCATRLVIDRPFALRHAGQCNDRRAEIFLPQARVVFLGTGPRMRACCRPSSAWILGRATLPHLQPSFVISVDARVVSVDRRVVSVEPRGRWG